MMNRLRWLVLPIVIGSVLTAVYFGCRMNRDTIVSVYKPEGEFYAYAPSVISDGKIDHIWTCQNAVEGQIKDWIFYIHRKNGRVVESRPVLSPGEPGAWDSYHVCDPSVIAGKFSYNGETYAHALFYLGNNVNASRQNQIGVAFAHDLTTEQWVKYPDPIIVYEGEQWGVGQPTAVSLGGGRVLLVYTKGHDGTITYRQELDLSDMDAGPVYVNEPHSLANLGLTGHNGGRDYLNNVDIVYDPTRERFYAVREQHPYPTGHPNYIGANVQIVSIPEEFIFNGGGEWVVEGQIDEALTGLARNHNAGFSRTASGMLPDPNVLRVIFAGSCGDSPDCQVAEWTYGLWEVTKSLDDQSQ
jgi:hypothetical protein